MLPHPSPSPTDAEVMPLRWYAAYTRHQHEKAAATHLAGKGIDVLLPLYRSLNRWKDRTKTVFLPLFPGYVFVHADLKRRLDVLRAPGVCWLVGSAGIPVAIPQPDIDWIRRLTEAPLACEPHPYLKCGHRVRVRSGPLEGMEGVLVRLKNRWRVVVTMDLLRQAAAVEMDAANLEPLPAAKGISVVPWERASQYS